MSRKAQATRIIYTKRPAVPSPSPSPSLSPPPSLSSPPSTSTSAPWQRMYRCAFEMGAVRVCDMSPGHAIGVDHFTSNRPHFHLDNVQPLAETTGDVCLTVFNNKVTYEGDKGDVRILLEPVKEGTITSWLIISMLKLANGEYQCYAITACTTLDQYSLNQSLGYLGSTTIVHTNSNNTISDNSFLRTAIQELTGNFPRECDSLPGITDILALHPAHIMPCLRAFLLNRSNIDPWAHQSVKAWEESLGQRQYIMPSRKQTREGFTGYFVKVQRGATWTCNGESPRCKDSSSGPCTHMSVSHIMVVAYEPMDYYQPSKFSRSDPTGNSYLEQAVPKGWLLSPSDDPDAIRGSAIFSPSEEDFVDEDAFRRRIHLWGRRCGAVKVEVPEGWLSKIKHSPADLNKLEKIVPCTLTYTKIMDQASWNVVREEKLEPGLMEPTGFMETHLEAERTKLRRLGVKIPSKDLRDPYTDLPSCGVAYTPELVGMLVESWKTNSGAGIVVHEYANDQSGENQSFESATLFRQTAVNPVPKLGDCLPWTLARLGDHFNKGVIFHGINFPNLYYGVLGSTFQFHEENFNLASISLNHFGAPKLWWAVPTAYSAKMREVLMEHFGLDHAEFIRDKECLVFPEFLRSKGIPVSAVLQRPGEMMMTWPGGWHGGFNLGIGLAEAVNTTTPDWFEHGLKTRPNPTQDTKWITNPLSVIQSQLRNERRFPEDWKEGETWEERNLRVRAELKRRRDRYLEGKALIR